MSKHTAMILAAGRGERMRPLTDTTPKPLLKVKQKALIEYHLSALKLAGYQRVVINHAWLGQQIEDYLGNGQKYGLDIYYSAESEALETAGGILNALPLLCPSEQDQYFTVVNGDVFTDFDFATLPSTLEDSKQAHLVMVNNPSHNPNGDFAYQHNELHRDEGEKLTFSGIAVYRKNFFDNATLGVLPLAPMLRQAIDKQLISAQHHTGQWTDVGTPERLAQLNL